MSKLSKEVMKNVKCEIETHLGGKITGVAIQNFKMITFYSIYNESVSSVSFIINDGLIRAQSLGCGVKFPCDPNFSDRKQMTYIAFFIKETSKLIAERYSDDGDQSPEKEMEFLQKLSLFKY